MKLIPAKKPTTVAAVLSAFSTTIQQLKDVEVLNQATAKRHRDIAALAEIDARVAEKEALLANEMATKLQSIFGT